jgi:fatty acid desaturase
MHTRAFTDASKPWQVVGGEPSYLRKSRRPASVTPASFDTCRTTPMLKQLDTRLDTRTSEFSLAEARHLVNDLFEPNPRIFWADFLITIAIGHIGYSLVYLAPRWLPEPLWLRLGVQAVIFVIYSLAFYRASMFTHELVHLRTGTFNTFRVAWNALCGVPFLMPSFTYESHLDHHRRKHFGTQRDGEYLPLGTQSPIHILLYLSQSFIAPLLAIFRFVVLTPLTWLSPPLRRWVHQHASSMVIDPSYLRPLPTKDAMRLIRRQEVFCFLGWGTYLSLILIFGKWPFPLLIQAYLTGVFVLTLNAVRTLGAHRFWNDGSEMTFVEQMLDSVNYGRRSWFTELWAPIGTRYHALHHLFPSMPYHNMRQAHQRLMERLPPDSPYREAESNSLISTIRDLWRRSRHAKKRMAHDRLQHAA